MHAYTSLKMFRHTIFYLSIIFIVFAFHNIGLSLSNKPFETEVNTFMPNLRPDIKKYIDDLYFFHVLSIEHTTDSLEEQPKIRLPQKPKPFDAGRFKITFEKESEKRAIICQTESIVGHYAKVVPGKTNIGGSIQILDDPLKNFSSGPTLNNSEVDYFIQMIYRKFTEPITDQEEVLLNKVKDIGLAILFSGKTGIDKYHKNQIKKLTGH